MFFFKNKLNKKVFVGVSGGVDSSVSAALLKDQGYNVVGVFIRTWQPDWIECTWREEHRDAIRVCAHLDIPFVELDLEREYKEGVADYMIEEYRKGKTPNPDVMCNREVKFGGFLKWALKNGADYIATGHYTQVKNNDSLISLIRGVDKNKDQSYFLWTLEQEQLKLILFPVGDIPKSKVRKLAKKYKLPTATKKDSQGICFIGEIDMKEFLRHYIDEKKGDVLDESEDVIGNHDGNLFYTIGERHGFRIVKKGINDKPYYVVSKNIENNTITVSQNPKKYNIDVNNNVYLDNIVDNQDIFKSGMELEAQIRYRGEIKKIKISSYNKKEKIMKIKFEKADPTLASGQSVVFYNGEICLGGGIIN